MHGGRLETKREDKKIDMLVDGRVVLELKATPVMEPVFKAQCFTYVKMLGLSSGLVLNFGRVTLKEGIARVINESKADYRTRLLREDPRAVRNLLVEEDGITLEEANRMQLAGDIGLHAEGSGRCRGHLSGETETGDRSWFLRGDGPCFAFQITLKTNLLSHFSFPPGRRRRQASAAA